MQRHDRLVQYFIAWQTFVGLFPDVKWKDALRFAEVYQNIYNSDSIWNKAKLNVNVF